MQVFVVLALIVGSISAKGNHSDLDINLPKSIPSEYRFGSSVGYINGRITHGQDAIAGSHPYQISLQRFTSGLNLWNHECGGSILSPTYVVTAAHCIAQLNKDNQYRVVAGILNLNDTGTSRQDINVTQVINHPSYKAGVIGPNDISLLKLSTPIQFNPVVKVISLPKAKDVPSGAAVLSGWGATSLTSNAQMSLRLQTLTVPILGIAECRTALDAVLKVGHPNATNPFDDVSNICTGPLLGGFSACTGDSGGPLAQNGTLVGLVSWGLVPCGRPGAPSVFTKVENFLTFIKANVPDLNTN